MTGGGAFIYMEAYSAGVGALVDDLKMAKKAIGIILLGGVLIQPDGYSGQGRKRGRFNLGWGEQIIEKTTCDKNACFHS